MECSNIRIKEEMFRMEQFGLLASLLSVKALKELGFFNKKNKKEEEKEEEEDD